MCELKRSRQRGKGGQDRTNVHIFITERQPDGPCVLLYVTAHVDIFSRLSMWTWKDLLVMGNKINSLQSVQKLLSKANLRLQQAELAKLNE